ncbi:unnamed protein product, partial [Allacma fusca]
MDIPVVLDQVAQDMEVPMQVQDLDVLVQVYTVVGHMVVQTDSGSILEEPLSTEAPCDEPPCPEPPGPEPPGPEPPAPEQPCDEPPCPEPPGPEPPGPEYPDEMGKTLTDGSLTARGANNFFKRFLFHVTIDFLDGEKISSAGFIVDTESWKIPNLNASDMSILPYLSSSFTPTNCRRNRKRSRHFIFITALILCLSAVGQTELSGPAPPNPDSPRIKPPRKEPWSYDSRNLQLLQCDKPPCPEPLCEEPPCTEPPSTEPPCTEPPCPEPPSTALPSTEPPGPKPPSTEPPSTEPPCLKPPGPEPPCLEPPCPEPPCYVPPCTEPPCPEPTGTEPSSTTTPSTTT